MNRMVGSELSDGTTEPPLFLYLISCVEGIYVTLQENFGFSTQNEKESPNK